MVLCYSHNFGQQHDKLHNCTVTTNEFKECQICDHTCFLVLDLNNTRVSAGCGIKHNDNTSPDHPDHCSSTCLEKRKIIRGYYCCCTSDYCNYNYTIQESLTSSTIQNASTINQSSDTSGGLGGGGGGEEYSSPSSASSASFSLWLSILIPILFVILIVIFLVSLYNKRRSRKNSFNNQNGDVTQQMIPMIARPQTDGANNNNSNHHHNYYQQHRLDAYNNNKETDLNEVKIDLSTVKLLEVLGQGRFGIVYRAFIGGGERVEGGDDDGDGDENDNSNDNNTDNGNRKEVAVKVTKAEEYQSWRNERYVYKSYKIKHQNILNYLYSDEHVESDSFWLIVEYAPRGSLSSYLRDNLVNWKDFLDMTLGIVQGLNHLHDAQIAHRDFKSGNILLKQDLTPCITDFGVAEIFDYPNGSHLEQRYHQVGTPRYMAPEVLECMLVITKSSILKIDVYALALVLWELLWRTNLPDELLPLVRDESNPDKYVRMNYSPFSYMLPFEDIAGPKPTIEQMVQIVVIDKRRPPIRQEWEAPNSRLFEFCKQVLREGWDTHSESRITASCVLERVSNLVDRERTIFNMSSHGGDVSL